MAYIAPRSLEESGRVRVSRKWRNWYQNAVEIDKLELERCH